MTSPDWLSPGIDAGRGKREDPRPIPQFNPQEERQSLWRGETTRKLSRPHPPSSVQITSPRRAAAARAHTHKDVAPSHPAPHILFQGRPRRIPGGPLRRWPALARQPRPPPDPRPRSLS